MASWPSYSGSNPLDASLSPDLMVGIFCYLIVYKDCVLTLAKPLTAVSRSLGTRRLKNICFIDSGCLLLDLVD